MSLFVGNLCTISLDNSGFSFYLLYWNVDIAISDKENDDEWLVSKLKFFYGETETDGNGATAFFVLLFRANKNVMQFTDIPIQFNT